MARRRLSTEDVETIRKLYAEGVSSKELAERYGVHRGYIPRITNGKARKSPSHFDFRKFDEKYEVDEKTGCWNWPIKSGSGRYGSYKNMSVHRYSYLRFKGEIPEGYCVCHKCDNTRCVNPDHLFTGTYTDNNRDMHAKGRGIHGENHHWSKLTEKDIEIAEKMRSEGSTWKEIGEHFGVTLQCIHNILSGKTWAWRANRGAQTNVG